MTYEIRTPLLIGKLIEMAKTVPNVPVDKLEQMMIQGLTEKDSKVFVDEINKEVRGFIFGTKESIDGEDVIFIQFSVIRPDKEEKHIGFELLLKMRLWAKENNIKWLYTMTNRNPKPYMRKYKFEFAYTMLKRRVEDERII